MAEQLSRTISSDSTQSWSGRNPQPKGSSLQPETNGGNVLGLVSMPPPASTTVPRHFSSRRPSRASDKSLFEHLWSASAPDESDSAAVGTGSLGSTLMLPETHLHRHTRSESDVDSSTTRMSFSDQGISPFPRTQVSMSRPGSIAVSEPEVAGTNIATANQHGGHHLYPEMVSSPTQTTANSITSITPAHTPTLAPSPTTQPMNPSTATAPTSASLSNPPRRSRSRTQRRISASTAASSPGSKDMREPRKPTKGIIGVCALESKARSKPARNIFGKLVDDFDVKIFGDKIILDEDVKNWPVCDFLISFFSDGFPLDKAIAYAKLRKPFCVNDLPMQQVLWDRRLCLMILDHLDVPAPRRIEVNRDGGPVLQSAEFAKALKERTGVTLGGPDGTGGTMKPPKVVEMIDDNNTIRVDGVTLTKPFVEKPVSGEDHNIHVYYHTRDGGGGRRLFRKVNNKSSEKDDTLSVPRCITEPNGSYIYEKFLKVENSEDVKAYTVGPNYCHAETRKSPVVDGLVKRNPSGKEVRYVTKLNESERAMASRISTGFGQRVCGFDLLRTGGRSYVIDVNGWSFVKDNQDYYESASKILRDLFLEEIARRERKNVQLAASEAVDDPAHKKKSLKNILKSPSMSKLREFKEHPHLPHLRHPVTGPSSPELSRSTTPIASSPTTEKPPTSLPQSAAAPSTVKSESDISPPLPDDVHELEVQASQSDELVNVPPPASKAQWKLKGVVSVIRHADRTPKQKFKYTFHTKPFVDLLKGHQEEVLLIGEAALQSVSDAVKAAMEERVEDPKKLRELQIYLNKKGAWPGTKVQIKPMFRKRRKEELLPGQQAEESPERKRSGSASLENPDTSNLTPTEILELAQKRSDSMSGVTLSRITAAENNLILDKLQLIIKWGGEPTHSARHQTQDMGANFRNDLLLMNRDVLDDVSIFSSSERRVTTSAQIFAAAFLDKDQYPAENIQVRKDLLDDSNAAKDVMDKVKKKLKTLLRAGDKAPPQFAWPKDVSEPYIVARQVVDLMKFHQRVMNHNFKKLESGAVSSLSAVVNPSPADGAVPGSMNQITNINQIQSRWCCNEGPELFKERWEKLFKEFRDADKVDPSKISELYDTMKFDALHNRQFLEWVFTPDSAFVEESTITEGSRHASTDSQRKLSSTADAPTKGKSSPNASDGSKSDSRDQSADKSSERGSISQRMGFRRRSEVAARPVTAPVYQHESYFKLYGGNSNNSKAQVDARLTKLRDMYHLCKVLFDYIGPQEYGIDNEEKLEIGLLTSLPLLREIVEDLEELQASDNPKCFFYFTKESHIYTLLNCILEGGIKTKIERNAIPELDYLSQIGFELYESENVTVDNEPNTFNYSIRITLSPGCHTFAPLDVQLDSRHMIGFSPRRSLTAHHDWKEVLETLRAKFHTVKLPKSFVAINLSEKVPDAFGERRSNENGNENGNGNGNENGNENGNGNGNENGNGNGNENGYGNGNENGNGNGYGNGNENGNGNGKTKETDSLEIILPPPALDG